MYLPQKLMFALVDLLHSVSGIVLLWILLFKKDLIQCVIVFNVMSVERSVTAGMQNYTFKTSAKTR